MVLGRFENNIQNDVFVFEAMQKSTKPHTKHEHFEMFLRNTKKITAF